MSKKMAGIIIAYGVALAVLGTLHRRIAPESGNLTLVTGVAGAIAAITCGVMAWLGHSRRAWIILTVAVASFFLMAQTVGSWVKFSENRNRNEAFLHTVMFALSAVMVRFTVHGERPPGYFSPGGAEHGNSAPK